MAHYPVITEPSTDPVLDQYSNTATAGEQLELFTTADCI